MFQSLQFQYDDESATPPFFNLDSPIRASVNNKAKPHLSSLTPTPQDPQSMHPKLTHCQATRLRALSCTGLQSRPVTIKCTRTSENRQTEQPRSHVCDCPPAQIAEVAGVMSLWLLDNKKKKVLEALKQGSYLVQSNQPSDPSTP